MKRGRDQPHRRQAGDMCVALPPCIWDTTLTMIAAFPSVPELVYTQDDGGFLLWDRATMMCYRGLQPSGRHR
jgi:hypothetical protein